MTDCIDKELQYINRYYSNKFHYKNITLKRYLKYKNLNPDFINNNQNSLSETNKDLKEFQYPLNPNCKCFTKVLDGINYQILTKSPKPILPLSISLSGPQQPYIHKGIGEQDR